MSSQPADDGFPTSISDLAYHLSSTDAHQSIYNSLSALRKSTLSVSNRLRSCLRDAEFVAALHAALSRKGVATDGQLTSWPLIPNERSGSWPLDPELKVLSQASYLHLRDPHKTSLPVSAYFKSTDGHIRQWAFSTRRLNLPVLEMLGQTAAHGNGCILIDTTRRGKSFPDALRRTVPIWCSVWNRALFPELQSTGICDYQGFRLDAGEVAQIEARIPGFVKDLQALGLDLQDLGSKVRYPMRCVWISQPSNEGQWPSRMTNLTEEIAAERKYWREKANIENIGIMVCCSASKQVLGAEMSADGYIQGAGDDTEHWSHGLTAEMFWEHKSRLVDDLNTDEDIEEAVKQIVAQSRLEKSMAEGVASRIAPTSNLFLATLSSKNDLSLSEGFDLIVDCNVYNPEICINHLCLGCKDGKLGSRSLREKLPLVRARAEKILTNNTEAKILVRCTTGKDLSVGVLLVLLCCCFDEQGKVHLSDTRSIDKQLIRQRLVWITSSKPDANPSRATLQAVNAFLMS